MAKQVTRSRPVLHEYYIYDQNVKNELGGHVVVERDGSKRVLLTPDQAKFWLDQGLLGTQPLEQRSSEARRVIDQFRNVPMEQQTNPEQAQQTDPKQAQRKTQTKPE